MDLKTNVEWLQGWLIDELDKLDTVRDVSTAEPVSGEKAELGVHFENGDYVFVTIELG